MGVVVGGPRRRHRSSVMVCVRAMQESRGYPLRPAHARRLRLRAETAVEGRPSTLATLLPGDAVRTTAFQKHSGLGVVNVVRQEQSFLALGDPPLLRLAEDEAYQRRVE